MLQRYFRIPLPLSVSYELSHQAGYPSHISKCHTNIACIAYYNPQKPLGPFCSYLIFYHISVTEMMNTGSWAVTGSSRYLLDLPKNIWICLKIRTKLQDLTWPRQKYRLNTGVERCPYPQYKSKSLWNILAMSLEVVFYTWKSWRQCIIGVILHH